jgi:hypothetical protein
MELLRFELKETTKTHHLFTIEVQTYGFWGKPRTEIHDCYRSVHGGQSKFISDGQGIYNRWLFLDYTIEAILSTKDKTYVKATF